MKSLLYIVAVVACVCAAYAVPVSEEKHDFPTVSLHDKLELDAHFDPSKLGTINGQLAASWMKYLPWGTMVDVVVDAIKKATE